MLTTLPSDFNQYQPEQVYQILNLQLDTIISEYLAFNHSDYLYPHLQDLQNRIQQFQELLPYQNMLEFQQLKIRSSQDPIIQDILWEHDEFLHPATSQMIKVQAIYQQQKRKEIKVRQISSCIEHETEKTQHNYSTKSLKLDEQFEQDEINEKYIPLQPIREFDEKSYISQIILERNPSHSTKEQIQSIMNSSINSYDDALIDDAFYFIQQAKSTLENNQDLNDWFNQSYGEFVTSIEEKMKTLQYNLEELSSTGWTVEKETKILSVKYKIDPKTSSVTIFFDGLFEADVTKLMALINEIELYASYAPFVYRSRMAKEITKTCKVCDICVYFPLISDRKAVFVGEGFDRLNINGTIVFMCKSVDNDPEFLAKYQIDISQEKKKFVSLIMRYYVFELTPISKTKCRVKAITNADPQVKFLPQAIVAFVARKMANTLCERMQKISKNFDKTPWGDQYQRNKEFYSWIEEKVNKYFQGTQNI